MTPDDIKALQERIREKAKKRPSSILGELVEMPPTKAKGKTVKPLNEKLNKTEVRYGQYLERKKLAGEILWYRNHAFSVAFEDGTRYTPDYVVMDNDGAITLVDCKAYRKNQKKVHIEEASLLKIKRTANEYWMFTMIVTWEIKGEWIERKF